MEPCSKHRTSKVLHKPPPPHPTSCRSSHPNHSLTITRALTVSALVAVTLLSFSSVLLVSALCPTMCTCIWKGGKQSAECEGEGLISIPSGVSPSTQVLNLNRNSLHVLPSKVFNDRGLTNLQRLFLQSCKLGSIAEDAFDKLKNLIELDLSHNLLTSVPSTALMEVSLWIKLLNHFLIVFFKELHHLGSYPTFLVSWFSRNILTVSFTCAVLDKWLHVKAVSSQHSAV